jgi:ferredoxin-NADP reductase
MAGWQSATLRDKRTETARAATLHFATDGWSGHRAGQHLDVRLTAEDGYQAQRSYSIASPPEDDGDVALTVERLDDGEVSPYLVDEMAPGDMCELRGPIGGWFVWDIADGGPLLLVGGGSGVVPLMSMLRHRAALRSDVPARLLLSSRSVEDILYADELRALDAGDDALDVTLTLTRDRAETTVKIAVPERSSPVRRVVPSGI